MPVYFVVVVVCLHVVYVLLLFLGFCFVVVFWDYVTIVYVFIYFFIRYGFILNY